MKSTKVKLFISKNSINFFCHLFDYDMYAKIALASTASISPSPSKSAR
jgi:hypothetical protein